MSRGLSKTELEMEWQALPKNWYAIYQWERTSRASYLEWIAEWIVDSFPYIQLLTNGIRSRTFRVSDHRGQISLNTKIEQLTEKRLVRAMFNSRLLPVLGKVIDYEIPLKDTDEATHGDIDLLCILPGTCLCVEAKKPKASESILKALLQAYTYTSLVSTKKSLFFSSFQLDPQLQLAPSILTFASAQSGWQLKEISKYPHLRKLIEMLDNQLVKIEAAAIRFFIVNNPDDEIVNCLTTTTEANGDVKVVFREGFELSIIRKDIDVKSSD